MKQGMFRAAIMMAMAAATQVGNNIVEYKKTMGTDNISDRPESSHRGGVCFHKTFTGKRQRIKAKKRDLRHHGKLVKMKHARA